MPCPASTTPSGTEGEGSGASIEQLVQATPAATQLQGRLPGKPTDTVVDPAQAPLVTAGQVQLHGQPSCPLELLPDDQLLDPLDLAQRSQRVVNVPPGPI